MHFDIQLTQNAFTWNNFSIVYQFLFPIKRQLSMNFHPKSSQTEVKFRFWYAWSHFQFYSNFIPQKSFYFAGKIRHNILQDARDLERFKH